MEPLSRATTKEGIWLREFIQQRSTERLLPVGHCSQCWGPATSETERPNLEAPGSLVLVKDPLVSTQELSGRVGVWGLAGSCSGFLVWVLGRAPVLCHCCTANYPSGLEQHLLICREQDVKNWGRAEPATSAPPGTGGSHLVLSGWWEGWAGGFLVALPTPGAWWGHLGLPAVLGPLPHGPPPPHHHPAASSMAAGGSRGPGGSCPSS